MPVQVTEQVEPHDRPIPAQKHVTVRMLKSQSGSINGINVEFYREGEIYSLPAGPRPLPDLGAVFLETKAAELVADETEEEDPPPVPESPAALKAEVQPQQNVEQVPAAKAEHTPKKGELPPPTNREWKGQQ